MKMQGVIINYGGHLCRRCFDARYKVHLFHRDVWEVIGTCACCGKQAMLVVNLKLSGRFKMLGKWRR